MLMKHLLTEFSYLSLSTHIIGEHLLWKSPSCFANCFLPFPAIFNSNIPQFVNYNLIYRLVSASR